MSITSRILDQQHEFEPFFPEQRITPSEDLVLDLESTIGIMLPLEYRQLLLRYGGTAPSTKKDCTPVVWVPARKGLYIADYFLGFFLPKPKPHIEMFDLRRAYQNWKLIVGTSFLPIIEGPGDDMFLIKLSGEQQGSIWAWLKDPVGIDTKWEDIQEIRGLYSVAPDILAFVNSFQEFERPGQE